jgi:hypothetical protein
MGGSVKPYLLRSVLRSIVELFLSYDRHIPRSKVTAASRVGAHIERWQVQPNHYCDDLAAVLLADTARVTNVYGIELQRPHDTAVLPGAQICQGYLTYTVVTAVLHEKSLTLIHAGLPRRGDAIPSISLYPPAPSRSAGDESYAYQDYYLSRLRPHSASDAPRYGLGSDL